jgi:16S rRNA (cytidine1402-2'-O)-methyltransferase
VTGRLVLAATPLGNAGDASRRLVEALATADVVAAEDTRRLRSLAAALGVAVTGRVVSHYEAVEAARVPQLLAAVRAGQTVLVLTDAGMPSVSDPGFRLVTACVAEGLPLTCLPGPSAVTVALALSGLPSDRFCFEGFLPRRGGERRARLAGLATEQRTLVLFEAPHRLAEMLDDAVAAFGSDRSAAICREMTKTHEEVRRGGLGELAAWAQGSAVRGEITLVIAGAVATPVDLSDVDLAELVAAAEDDGMPRKEAIAAVAKTHGRPRRAVYEAVLRYRRQPP